MQKSRGKRRSKNVDSFWKPFTFICLSLLQKRYESIIAIKLVDIVCNLFRSLHVINMKMLINFPFSSFKCLSIFFPYRGMLMYKVLHILCECLSQFIEYYKSFLTQLVLRRNWFHFLSFSHSTSEHFRNRQKYVSMKPPVAFYIGNILNIIKRRKGIDLNFRFHSGINNLMTFLWWMQTMNIKKFLW